MITGDVGVSVCGCSMKMDAHELGGGGGGGHGA